MDASRDYLVWGSSGHGKVLRDLIRSQGGEVVALVDSDKNALSVVAGCHVLHGLDALKRAVADGTVKTGISAAIAIGGARGADRRSIAAELKLLGFALPPLVHGSAIVSSSATLGEGSHVLANAVVAADAVVGSVVIVNHGAVVDHECVLADGVHVAPGATLCGCVRVEQDSMIGAGATVMPRVSIGRQAIVGAGALVRKHVAAKSVVAGVPAHVLRGQNND
jgi:sugar O-acyltransferase (sialic acid O-acetyltransferase NeuD family)